MRLPEQKMSCWEFGTLICVLTACVRAVVPYETETRSALLGGDTHRLSANRGVGAQGTPVGVHGPIT